VKVDSHTIEYGEQGAPKLTVRHLSSVPKHKSKGHTENIIHNEFPDIFSRFVLQNLASLIVVHEFSRLEVSYSCFYS
jgi:hypothetical protein